MSVEDRVARLEKDLDILMSSVWNMAGNNLQECGRLDARITDLRGELLRKMGRDPQELATAGVKRKKKK